MSISEARSSSYEYFPPNRESYETARPILSVIVDCYYKLDLVKQSIQSVINQDYSNVELILVDNGAELDVREYLSEVYFNIKNVSLIQFEENQFSWDDIEKSVAVCWNAALIHSKGDFVCHLSYDDMISSNYATRMVRLFEENPKCATAAPLPYLINAEGEISPDRRFNVRNSRGRFTDGCALAFDLIEGSPNKLFASPGEIFVIRRELLLKYGGYDRIIDLSQVLKYAILGSSGFDSEAALFWRHHDGQLNRQAKRNGLIWYASHEKGWVESGIVNLWRNLFDDDKVSKLMAFKKKSLAATPITVVAENMRRLSFIGVATALWNIKKECPVLLPKAAYAAVRELLSVLVGDTLRKLRLRR